MTSGTPDDASAPRPRPLPVPSLPRASSPAGSLPPGSAPAVGWQASTGPRLPDRRRRGRKGGSSRSATARALAESPPSDDTTSRIGGVGQGVGSAAGEAADPTVPWESARNSRPARRQPMLLQGLMPALLAGVLAAVAGLGAYPFALAVLGVQVLLVLALLALIDAPASGGAFLVSAAALVAADVVILVDDGDIRWLAGVVALSVIGSLLHQLLRPRRSRVTESIADTLVAATLAVSAACLLALRALEGGDETVQVALVAAGASLLAARIGDRLASRPMLAVGSTRGWPGLLLGLGAGVAAAVVVAGDEGVVVGTQAALMGLVCAATVAAADLAVDLGAAELRAGRRDARRVEALKPANLLLPFALLGPISLVAGELVLG